MSISLGSTNFGSLYLGSTKIGEAYLGSVKVYGPNQPDPFNPLGLPPYTMRFQFENSSYDPTAHSLDVTHWKPGSTWTKVSDSPNVWDYTLQDPDWSNAFNNIPTWQYPSDTNISVLGANTRSVTNMTGLFGHTKIMAMEPFSLRGVTSLAYMFTYSDLQNVTLPLFDTSRITDMSYMFEYAIFGMYSQYPNGYTLPSWDVSHVTNMERMFKDTANSNSQAGVIIPSAWSNSVSLKILRWAFYQSYVWDAQNLYTNNVTDFQYSFMGCYFKGNGNYLPAINTDGATDVERMFSGNSYCNGNILNMYNQLSANQNIFSYSNCFLNCGSNTTTGQAELAQIPGAWGGTAS